MSNGNRNSAAAAAAECECVRARVCMRERSVCVCVCQRHSEQRCRVRQSASGKARQESVFLGDSERNSSSKNNSESLDGVTVTAVCVFVGVFFHFPVEGSQSEGLAEQDVVLVLVLVGKLLQ